jgi:hypothetical protein
MTTAAWVFMLSVWGIILGMVCYCFRKILTSPRRLDVEMQEVVEYQQLPEQTNNATDRAQ